MISHTVVIVGAGPTGMTLAAELALANVDVGIVERRPSGELESARAGGLHCRTLEAFDQRGIADRFLSAGQTAQAMSFASVPLDLSGFPTRHPYVLGLWQNHIERILAAWIDELGVPVHRDCAVTALTQTEAAVEIAAVREPLRAQYVVGCDGGRSVVRKAAGIDFAGWDATTSNLIAEVEMSETPELGTRQDARGVHGIGRLDYEIVDGKVVFADEGPVRLTLTEAQPKTTGEPTLRDLSDALITVYGTDFGVHSPKWISRFTDTTRQATHYRSGRVFLAGDAAHIHSPVGGQGLNTGVQDAMNLGWKLAAVAHGTARDDLLDSYHAERHPVGARVLDGTMAGVALLPATPRNDALRAMVGELAALPEGNRLLAGRFSGLDIHYDLGAGHPLLGRRMPDLDVVTAEGPRRVYELLHEARPVLLDLGAPPGSVDVAHGWAERVQLVTARYDAAWELPVLGQVAAPDAVLIRPDGYVAWVGEGTDAGLPDALTTWFGPAS